MKSMTEYKGESGGFTIVELIMVIVVLGILATFALPRFPRWNSEARIAAVEGMKGSVHAAAALAQGTALSAGVSAGATISMDGQNVTMQYHTPTHNAAGIGASLQSYKGFSLVATGSQAVFTFNVATNPGGCYVAYAQATGTGQAATISSDTSGC